MKPLTLDINSDAYPVRLAVYATGPQTAVYRYYICLGDAIFLADEVKGRYSQIWWDFANSPKLPKDTLLAIPSFHQDYRTSLSASLVLSNLGLHLYIHDNDNDVYGRILVTSESTLRRKKVSVQQYTKDNFLRYLSVDAQGVLEEWEEAYT